MQWWHNLEIFPRGLLSSRSAVEARIDFLNQNFQSPKSDFYELWEKELNLYNLSVEGFKNFNALRKSEAKVVTTGQQAVIAGGPLLVFYKALSCIQHAKYLSNILDTQIVPVFWIAGDDSDFSECNILEHLSLDKVFHFSEVHREANEPVTLTKLKVDNLAQWKSFLKLNQLDTLGISDSKLLEYFDQAQNFVGSFGQFIAKVFASDGLLVIDGGGEAVRSVESQILAPIWQQNSEVQKSLQEQAEFLKVHGVSTQVPLDENKYRLFELSNGKRERLYLHHKVDPSKVVHDALSRPFLLEGLFPVVGHVLGPAELKYFALIQKTFDTLGWSSPLVVKRSNATLVKRMDLQLAQQLEIEVEDLCLQTRSRLAKLLIEAKYFSEITELKKTSWNWPESKWIDQQVLDRFVFKKEKLLETLISTQIKSWLLSDKKISEQATTISRWYGSGRVQERHMTLFEASSFFDVEYLKRTIDGLSENHQFILEPQNDK